MPSFAKAPGYAVASRRARDNEFGYGDLLWFIYFLFSQTQKPHFINR